MTWHRTIMTHCVFSALLACGSGAVVPVGSPSQPNQRIPIPSDTTGSPDPNFGAHNHTPGYFRDTYRLLSAQAILEDNTAAYRLHTTLQSLANSQGELPSLETTDLSTLQGIVILALRSVQATANTPAAARHLGEKLLRQSLGLDPALDAYVSAGGQAQTTSGGSLTLAQLSLWAVENAGLAVPDLCNAQAYASYSLELGSPVMRWVDEVCEDDHYVGAYCEPDRWIEGQCFSDWVDEDCSGGYWRDEGYYQYYCTYDECRYVWRSIWVYEEGACYGGYYEEYCNADYYEPGICYDGDFIPGVCYGGYWEEIYPGATWHFATASVPSDCDAIRPSQYAIALASISMLKATLYNLLDPTSRAGIDALLTHTTSTTVDEAAYGAALKLLTDLTADK